jgi:hypothetical protein
MLVFATETYALVFYLSAKLKRFQNSFHNQKKGVLKLIQHTL